jgi:phage shock protein PspC (stress-responsive transcriptional regulator)
MSLADTLNKITLSKSDRVVLGVCGGFAQATQTPSWIWRAAFCISAIFGGAGAIAYLILWYFMPRASGPA